MENINGSTQEINEEAVGQREQAIQEKPQAQPDQEAGSDQEVVCATDSDGKPVAQIVKTTIPLKDPKQVNEGKDLPGGKYQLPDGRIIKRKHLITRYDPGNAPNPWCSYPRNLPCFCGSGVKFKICCDGLLHAWVTKKEAESMKVEMAQFIEVVQVLKSNGMRYQTGAHGRRQA